MTATTLNSLEVLTSILIPGATYPVKDLARLSGISESRVRELLKEVPGIQSDDAKPRSFWVDYNPEDPPEVEAEEPQQYFDEAPAAPEAEPTPAEEPEPAPVATKKRVILNPQPQIDKKTEAVEAAGGTISYSARTWTVARGESVHTLTSREFSEYAPEELVALLG